VIFALFSGATYLRYRAAAWRAFDTDLQTNLDTLQTEFTEEIRQAEDVAKTDATLRDPLRRLDRAADQAVAAFRLNGLYAEIRLGAAATGTPLARVAGAGVGEQESLLDPAAWKTLAGAVAPRVLVLPRGRRGVARTFRPTGSHETVTLVIADKTTLVEQTLGAIRWALFEFGAVGLLLALGGGYWLATRALRPIDTLTSEAGAMASSPSAPGSRLAIVNPDDELGRLGMTFNCLLERIELSMAQTKAFIADAAHELKTPVAIVRTEAELSLSRHRSLEESHEALSTIAAESLRLSRLVSDLTLLAEGELLEHPLEQRLVDLRELLQDVARSLRSLAQARRVEVEVEAPVGVEYRGDERVLRQIFVNLLENAIKFSPPDSLIGTSLSRNGEVVELNVLDQAPTLSPADRVRVFERFYRSARATRGEPSGSGLGLAIVAWAVKLHGGRVHVEPRSPVGNRFVVTLPLEPESAAGT
jgi:signal transduction histidine kinase